MEPASNSTDEPDHAATWPLGRDRPRASLVRVNTNVTNVSSDDWLAKSDAVVEEIIETFDSHTAHQAQSEDEDMGEDGEEEEGPVTLSGHLRMAVAVVLHGVGTGLVGIFVFYLIDVVQHLGFGHAEGASGFLQLAEQAPVWRRIASVTVAGFLAALSWYTLRGMEPRFVPVDISMSGTVMPAGVTILNAMIQDIAVALGGSFGREAAPREMASMLGGHIGDWLRVNSDQRRILVACGTGGGLAAVYSVPLSGACYIIEHILDWDTSPQAVIPATVVSLIATAMTYTTVPTQGLYSIAAYNMRVPSFGIMLWAAMIGPVCGLTAKYFMDFIGLVRPFRPKARFPATFETVKEGQFVRTFEFYRTASGEVRNHFEDTVVVRRTEDSIVTRKPGSAEEKEYSEAAWSQADVEGVRDWRILVLMPAAFFILAIFCAPFPSLLGNGRALALVAIQQARYWYQLSMLLFLKAFCTGVAIGSGADGGTLTPSVALGATLGVVVGSVLHYFLGMEFAPMELMAMVSAAAFLASTMQAPVTAVLLVIEFSAQVFIPMDTILQALQGNVQPLLDSDFAIGTVMPFSLAGFLSYRTYRLLKRAPVHGRRRSSRSLSLPAGLTVTELSGGSLAGREKPPIYSDMDWGHDHDSDTLDWHADSVRGNEVCFHAGLLMNTGLTCFAAALELSEVRRTTRVSFLGLFCAGAVTAVLWKREELAPFIHESGSKKPHRITHHSLVEPFIADGELSPRNAHKNRRTLRAALHVSVFAALGAVMPTMPWIFHVWAPDPWDLQDLTHAEAHHGGILALIASLLCALMASAVIECIRDEVAKDHVGHTGSNRKATPQTVAHHVFVALSVAAVASAGGFTVGKVATMFLG